MELTEVEFEKNITNHVELAKKMFTNPDSPEIVIAKKYMNRNNVPEHTFISPKLVKVIDGIEFYEIPLEIAKNHFISKEGHVIRVTPSSPRDKVLFLRDSCMSGETSIGIKHNGILYNNNRNRLMMITFENIKYPENWFVRKLINRHKQIDLRNLVWQPYETRM